MVLGRRTELLRECFEAIGTVGRLSKFEMRGTPYLINRPVVLSL